MALANRLESAPSHRKYHKSLQGNEFVSRRYICNVLLALEIKLFQSTLEPEIAANKENIWIAKLRHYRIQAQDV